MNKRLKEARKALKISQREFGRRLGVTDAAISKLESAERNLTEQMLLAICNEFNVSEIWLRTGSGEMFVQSDKSLIDKVIRENGFDPVVGAIIEAYAALPPEYRQGVKEFIVNIANRLQSGIVDPNDILRERLNAEIQAHVSRTSEDPPNAASEQ